MNYNKEIQKRLPKGIRFVNESKIEMTKDEFIGILSWIKDFNMHYRKHGMDEPLLLNLRFPVISTRLALDLGLFHIPYDDNKNGYPEKHFIYLIKTSHSGITSLINTWQL